MKTATIKVVDDWGMTGIMLSDMRMIANGGMASLEGRIIAHDLIEHVNGIKAIGSVDDELEAIGAIWAVRGQFCDISRPYYGMVSPEESCANEVINLAGYYFNGVPFHTPIPDKQECNASYDIKTIIEIARKKLREDEDFDDCDINKFLKAAKRYMRQGYNKLEKSWDSTIDANRTFWYIAEGIDEFIKKTDLIEDAEYIMTYSSNYEDFCIEEKWQYDLECE